MRERLRLTLGPAVLAAAAAAQDTTPAGWVGEHAPRLVAMDRALVDDLNEQKGRLVPFGPIEMHPVIDDELALEPGRKAGELELCGPGEARQRIRAPGIWRVQLRIAERRCPTHWLVGAHPDGAVLLARTVAQVRIGKHELAFLDLDHDGAFGGAGDGWAARGGRRDAWLRTPAGSPIHASDEPLELDGARVWFTLDAAATELRVRDTPPDPREDLSAALARLAAARAALGLGPVREEQSLSIGCERHARYCAAHDRLTHLQELGLREYSDSGARAGRNSVLGRIGTMRDAIELWLGTFYHRVEMLSPSLEEVGVGFHRGFAVLDVLSRRDADAEFPPYAWPVDEAENVPLHWRTGEDPSPTGEPFPWQVAAGYGYPITLTFCHDDVAAVEARLLLDGEPVEVFVSTPERPGNPAVPDNTFAVLVMARAPLLPERRYEVSIRGTQRGRAFRRDWSFRTGAR